VTTLPTPGSAADGGEADIQLAAALAQFADDGAENPVLSLLSAARLLVPVVATATDPAAGDKDTDISAVLMRGRDGRLGLLAFTCVDSLRRWNAQARPVPTSGRDAAQAARAQGGDALLVDLAGPVPFLVESAELAELAAGHHLRKTSVGYAWFAHI
jgi:SseB protein N-terminal domain